MANEKNDIGDIVKKCKILLLDIEGTTTSISFVKDKLFPYAEENVRDFLDNEWESEDVKEAVAALRKLALEDEEKKVDGVVIIPAEDASKDEQIGGLVKNVRWQMSSDRKVGPLKQLQGLIWKKGYDKGDIQGHVYDDVSPALELWRSVEGQKIYIYSSGSVQAQKLLFGKSSAGDMLKLIDGHFDTAVGAKQDAASYTAIVEKIGCKAEEILFLTDIDKEAEAARSAGLQAALVSREGNAPLSDAVTGAYPVLYSFTELAATKKRKPDAQEDKQPSKVPKTDVETDVKTTIETEVKDSPQPITTPLENISEKTEKMEVEEGTVAKQETVSEKSKEDVVKQIEITVEEITSSKEAAELSVTDAKPIITESAETEMMETEPIEIVNSVSNTKANGDKDASVPEETLPVVITEIKDITNDKESLSEVTEIIEDLVPIVEEPEVQEMQDLQNVGEVLEKECDEILSKVQDVTNLDNISLKSLHPIAEETLETENMDSNDIVEGILDSEQELEMKKCTDIGLKTVKDISAAKPTTDVDKSETQEVTDKPSEVVVPKENPLENVKEKVNQATLNASSSQRKKSSLPEENAMETSVKEEKVEKTVLAEEKVKETISTEEKVKESNLSENQSKVSILEEDKGEESNQAEEKVTENSSAEKQDSNLSEENVKRTCDAEEKVKDSSITEAKVEDSSTLEQKVKDSCFVEGKSEENKAINDEKKTVEEKIETKMETDLNTQETNNRIKADEKEDKSESEEMRVEAEKSDAHTKQLPTESNAKTVTKESSMEVDQTETKVSEKVATTSTAEMVQTENDSKETQVNGKATNGDADMVDLNGEAGNDDELSSRLSMENGKEVVNGANGNSIEEAKSENNGDDVKEVADIKAKTVAMDEPRNDPIEQPTEA